MKVHVVTFFRVTMNSGYGSPKAQIGHAGENKSQTIGSKSRGPKYRILRPDWNVCAIM